VFSDGQGWEWGQREEKEGNHSRFVEVPGEGYQGEIQWRQRGWVEFFSPYKTPCKLHIIPVVWLSDTYTQKSFFFPVFSC